MLIEKAERRALVMAVMVNFVWINISEVARYFLLVRPMLQAAFPDRAEVAPMNWGIFALWGVWDVILIIAATGFYYLWLAKFGSTWRQVFIASGSFTFTIFGLIWLGVANMGLAPYSLLFAALPPAWIEQAIAALIVVFVMKRAYPPSSMRSI